MLSINFLTIAIFGLGVLAVLSIGFSWLFARLFCKPKRLLPIRTPADYKLPFEPVTFPSRGTSLNGWFIFPKGNPTLRPTIIVAHGWSVNAGHMLPLARLLHYAGFGIFLYDARGHGTSGDGGPMTLLKFAEDLIAAVDYLAGRPDVDSTRLGVVGHSMGGAGAIVAASMDTRIRAVVSSSAFADPETLIRHFMRAHHIPLWPFFGLVRYFIERWLGTTMADIAPKNRVGQITTPLLLIHGDSDPVISPTNLETLYTWARQEYVDRWLVQDRLHSDVMRDPLYGLRVIKFLERHLSFEQQGVVKNQQQASAQPNGTMSIPALKPGRNEEIIPITTFTTLDGRKITIRRIRDNDVALLVDMFHHLSERTKQLRFHTYGAKCSDQLIWREAATLCHLDPKRQVALVAIVQESDGEHAVGVARFSRKTPDDIEAEAAIVVRDDFQHAGLGTHLMVNLRQVACSMGITQFNAWVLPENRNIFQMFNKIGWPLKQNTRMGETHMVVYLDKSDELLPLPNAV